MKKAYIKTVSAVLAALLVAVSAVCAIPAFAQEEELETNKTMFDNILNNRSWIIDTLVNDDLSTNPVAYVLNVSDGFLDEIVDNYEKSGAYKLLVDAFDTSENAAAYLTQWSETAIAAILYELGQISSDELLFLVDEEIQSVDNRRYSAILTDIFSEDYTASWGTKLLEEEADAQQLSDLNDNVKTVSNYKSFLKSNLDLFFGDYRSGTYDSDTFISEFNDYTDSFLKVHDEIIKEVGIDLGLHYYQDADSGTAEGRKQKAYQKLRGMTLSTALALGEGYTPVNLLKNGTIKTRANNALTTSMPKGLKNGLKTFGTALDGASTVFEYATLLTHMINQYDTTVASMQRLKTHATSQDMRNAIDDILSLYEDGDTWEDYALACLRDVVKNNKTIGKTILKKGSELLNATWEYIPSAKSAAGSALTAGAVKNLVKLGKAVSIGVWIGDKLTDIKTSAKKVYVAKFTKKLIKAAAATYRADYAAYQSDPTEENARNCINDLQFIKRLRLYGEKQAFESTTAMTDSIWGLIITSIMDGEDARDYMENRHKAYNDALLGCVAVPDRNGSFTIEDGCELRIGTDIFENGKYITVARYYDKDGKLKKTIPEADWLLGTHLTLNGGTLTVANGYDPNGVCPAFLQLDANGGTVNIGSNGLYFGNLNVTKPATVNITNESAEVLVSQQLKNTSTLTVSGGNIVTYDLNNTGTVNMTNAEIEVRGQLSNSGTINGGIRITGCQVSPFAVGMMEASKPEIISTGAVAKLTFNSSYKEGVKISGSQTVTEYLNTNRTRIRNGENIYISGSCAFEGNIANGTLSFKDYTAPSALSLRGGARIFGDVSFPYGAAFGDALSLTSSCNTLTLGGDTTVMGDTDYTGGSIVGAGYLKLGGDLTVSVRDPNIQKLDFIGTNPQTVSSSNALTVSELTNHNTSRGGVNFNSRINVTGTLRAASTAAFTNGRNVVLTGSAGLEGAEIKGSLSAENWTVPADLTVKGALFSSGAVILPPGRSLTVSGYFQSGGTLNVGEGALLYTRGDWSCGAAVTDAGTIRIEGDAGQTGTLTGGVISVKGDLNASAAFTPDHLIFSSKVSQQFTNSKETRVRLLTVDNSSAAGMTFNSTVRVTEKYAPGTSTIRIGANIIYQSGDGTVTEDANGDVTWQGTVNVPAGETVTVGGSLNLADGAAVTVEAGASLIVKKNLLSSGAAIAVNEGGALSVSDYTSLSGGSLTVEGTALFSGDWSAGSCALGGGGVITLKGDLSATGCVWNEPNLTFESRLPQSVSSNGAIDLNDLTLNNPSKGGVSLGCKVNVGGVYRPNGNTVSGVENLCLVNGSEAGLPTDVSGAVTLNGPFRVEDGKTVTVDGAMTLASGASLTVPAGSALTVRRSLTCSGGTITVEEGGTLTVRDYLNVTSGTVTNDGELTVVGDAALAGTVGGSGVYVFKGDLNAGGTWNSPNVKFQSKLPQYVTGSTFCVNDLTIDNSGQTGVTIQTTVRYGGALTTGDSPVTGAEKLVKQ